MRKFIFLLLLLSPNAYALTPIEMADAQRVAGRMVMNIAVAQDGTEWVYYKFQIRFSSASTPVTYCARARLLNPAYGAMTDTTVLSFLQDYGPLPNTSTPEFINIPWCEQ